MDSEGETSESSSSAGHTIGHNSLGLQEGGQGNTAVGSSAGYYNVTGDDNTYLGKDAGKGAAGQSRSTSRD